MNFEQAAQAILNDALELRKTHGEPEAIDIPLFTSEESLRKAGIEDISLTEHTERSHHIAYLLQEHGFMTNVYTVAEED